MENKNIKNNIFDILHNYSKRRQTIIDNFIIKDGPEKVLIDSCEKFSVPVFSIEEGNRLGKCVSMISSDIKSLVAVDFDLENKLSESATEIYNFDCTKGNKKELNITINIYGNSET